MKHFSKLTLRKVLVILINESNYFNYDQDFEYKYLDLEIQLSGPVLSLEFHF